ncbi:hypothetical protein I4F81_003970 [Pyropia yezoensis]|uniref:Uncharacterized protein n=1 Tax=Pyropia yezoensis TaxID=2788 RepID=A0ACC3BUM3_PYRYE|nr:hypothetical protein I4F81_003970 [Neopyropia yezoensis]
MTLAAALPARTVLFLVASGASTHYLYEHCPLVVVAGVGLGAAYVRSRGLRAADLTWVSRSSFEGTVEALRGSLGRLAGVIGSTKRELGERLGRVEGAVDAAAVDLRALVEADVGGRVTEVGNALEGMRADMDELRSEVHGLGGDVASITRGLGLLCTVVGGGGADPATRAALERFGAAHGGGGGGGGGVKGAAPPAGLLGSPAAAVSAAAAAVAAAASAAASGGFRSILPPAALGAGGRAAVTDAAMSPPSVVVEEADGR